jgi:hypothetical protein
MKLVSRFTRAAGGAASILSLSLAAFTAAIAQAPAQTYGFCQGLAGNPRVNNFTRLFVLGPSSPPGAISGFLQFLHTKYAGATTQEIGCRSFTTAAEAETAYRKELADSAAHAATWPLIEIDWIPEGGSAVSRSGLAPASAQPAAAPKPQPTATAPAMDKYAVCWANRNAKVKYYSAVFDGSRDDAGKWWPAFQGYLEQKYGFDGLTQCIPARARADAESHLSDLIGQDRKMLTMQGKPPEIVETGWQYKYSATDRTDAAAPVESVPAATPTTSAPTAPAAPAASAPTAQRTYFYCHSSEPYGGKVYVSPLLESDAGAQALNDAFANYLAKAHGYDDPRRGYRQLQCVTPMPEDQRSVAVRQNYIDNLPVLGHTVVETDWTGPPGTTVPDPPPAPVGPRPSHTP